MYTKQSEPDLLVLDMLLSESTEILDELGVLLSGSRLDSSGRNPATGINLGGVEDFALEVVPAERISSQDCLTVEHNLNLSSAVLVRGCVWVVT